MHRDKKKKKKAQMKEQIKTPKIELSDKETANLSDAELKTLVIRMLTKQVECGCKLEGKMKAMQSEIKENIQGTNSEGKKTRTQINSLEQKKKKSFNQSRMKKQFKKMRTGKGISGQLQTFQCLNHRGARKRRGRQRN